MGKNKPVDQRSLMQRSGPCLALAAALAASAAASSAQETRQTAQPPVQSVSSLEASSPIGATFLWQDLAAGMTPEEVLPLVEALDGVKKARLFKRRDEDRPRQMKINYSSDKLQIAGMPFEIEPRFASQRLEQVWLASTGQCSNEARAIYERLSAGLVAKYPEVVFEDDMFAGDIARAHLRALESGEKVPISHIYASDDVAVVLTFAFSAEQPPPHPGFGSKFVLSVWRLAMSNYETRKAECRGTGDERMDVAIQYKTRSALETQADATAREMAADQEELVDQL